MATTTHEDFNGTDFPTPKMSELRDWESCYGWCMHGGTCELIKKKNLDLEDLWGDLRKNLRCICPASYTGYRCGDLDIDFAQNNRIKNVGEMVAGLVVGSFVLVAIIGMAIILWRRCRFIKRQQQREKQMRSHKQNRGTIEGFSVVDGSVVRKTASYPSMTPRRSCTSVSSGVQNILISDDKNQTITDYKTVAETRNPYGSVTFRVEGPLLTNSSRPSDETARQSHNKSDTIVTCEKNNNDNVLHIEENKKRGNTIK